jgi:hypothetical protein
MAEVELEHILATLHTTNGVIAGWNGAAAPLGLSRTTLISRMHRLAIGGRDGVANPPGAPSRITVKGVRRRPQVDAG